MQSNTAAQISTIAAKPILKWAGGKTQMLGELFPKVPSSYGRYIEPFFGGGALFFALQPENAVIADSNPELINMYCQVADHVDDVISYLEKYQNTSEMFYSVRSLDWETLPKAEAAARTIYLNRTCYNGLYRVNKKINILIYFHISPRHFPCKRGTGTSVPFRSLVPAAHKKAYAGECIRSSGTHNLAYAQHFINLSYLY